MLTVGRKSLETKVTVDVVLGMDIIKRLQISDEIVDKDFQAEFESLMGGRSREQGEI